MTEHSFSLLPFSASNIPDMTISGIFALQNNIITLKYSLTGKINDVLLPSTSVDPRRKDELWKATCFEFFLAIKNEPQYWEFNLSPSGDWNVYRMDAYRRVGFREEALIQQLQIETTREENKFTLDSAADLTPIIQHSFASQTLQFGISAILQTQSGNVTYWALTHPGSEADFHLRESFILSLAGQSQLRNLPGPND